ncbi:MAG: prepilin-type N-terminal cleavage/methylation domain-containing protein [bacterium]|nr:prepilin-type N-terminal cleavage/methylation domain-containing protein [bacterium]
MNKKHFGFTLIELLIVVAIIAILAAIAIPNFLAAQTRSKAAKTKGELRTLATGLEAYYVDQTAYPHYRTYIGAGGKSNCISRLVPLTTPVAYITRVPYPDPFMPGQFAIDPNYNTYDFMDEESIIGLFPTGGTATRLWGGHTWGRAWRLAGCGPDKVMHYGAAVQGNTAASQPKDGWPAYYDPTNGTISNGDILRFGGMGKITYWGGGTIVGPIE